MPRRLSWQGDPGGSGSGERQVETAEVVDSWLTPDHHYFKVAGPFLSLT